MSLPYLDQDSLLVRRDYAKKTAQREMKALCTHNLKLAVASLKSNANIFTCFVLVERLLFFLMDPHHFECDFSFKSLLISAPGYLLMTKIILEFSPLIRVTARLHFADLPSADRFTSTASFCSFKTVFGRNRKESQPNSETASLKAYHE